MTMPERIWADHGDDVDVYGGWDLDGSAGTEYVRADLVAELVAAAEEVLTHRVGTLPREGYLRDNDRSRAAIDRLATALARAKGGTRDR